MDFSPPLTGRRSAVVGMLCGAGSALFWALGFVAARHGVLAGMSPLVLSLHRFVWPGLALLPLVTANGGGGLGGLGWGRGITLTVFGGLPLALFTVKKFCRTASAGMCFARTPAANAHGRVGVLVHHGWGRLVGQPIGARIDLLVHRPIAAPAHAPAPG